MKHIISILWVSAFVYFTTVLSGGIREMSGALKDITHEIANTRKDLNQTVAGVPKTAHETAKEGVKGAAKGAEDVALRACY